MKMEAERLVQCLEMTSALNCGVGSSEKQLAFLKKLSTVAPFF